MLPTKSITTYCNCSKEMKPTYGAQVTIVYWPGKCSVTNEIIMFKLELWEAGSGITGRFEHLETMDHPDSVVLVFSSTDRNSFDSLPDLLDQIQSEGDLKKSHSS